MKLCKDCKYFVKPSWWKKFQLSEYAEECSNPDLVDSVNGDNKPCSVMRIFSCGEEGKKFEMR